MMDTRTRTNELENGVESTSSSTVLETLGASLRRRVVASEFG